MKINLIRLKPLIIYSLDDIHHLFSFYKTEKIYYDFFDKFVHRYNQKKNIKTK